MELDLDESCSLWTGQGGQTYKEDGADMARKEEIEPACCQVTKAQGQGFQRSGRGNSV